jgi:hypothetical protein
MEELMNTRMKTLASVAVALVAAAAMAGCGVETEEGELTESEASALTTTCTPGVTVTKSSSGNSEITVSENGVVKTTATHLAFEYTPYYQKQLKKQFSEADFTATTAKPYFSFGRSYFTRADVGGVALPMTVVGYTATTPLRYAVRLCKPADPCEGVVLPACPRACTAFPMTGTCTNGDLCGNSSGDSCSCAGGTWSCINHAPLGTGCNSVCR